MKKCIACHSVGKISIAEHKDQVFGSKDAISTIRLCYNHSVEFFKTGQTKFVVKYRPESIEYDLRKEHVNPLNNYFVFDPLR